MYASESILNSILWSSLIFVYFSLCKLYTVINENNIDMFKLYFDNRFSLSLQYIKLLKLAKIVLGLLICFQYSDGYIGSFFLLPLGKLLLLEAIQISFGYFLYEKKQQLLYDSVYKNDTKIKQRH